MGPVFDNSGLIREVSEEYDRLGIIFVREVQSRIPPGGSNSNFPGDGPPTGALKSSFRRRRVYLSSKDSITTTVYIDRSKAYKYWLVHEDGKVIKPKTKNFMTFHYQGHWWKTKSVTIKPKHYIRDSIAALEQEIATNTDKRIRQYIQFSVRLR